MDPSRKLISIVSVVMCLAKHTVRSMQDNTLNETPTGEHALRSSRGLNHEISNKTKNSLTPWLYNYAVRQPDKGYIPSC